MTSPIPDYVPRTTRQKERTPRWMMTFADLLSLLLTFFVLLYAMRVVEQAEFEEVSISLAQALRPNKDTEITHPSARQSIIRIEQPENHALEYLAAILEDKLRESDTLQEVFTVTRQEDRVILSLHIPIFERETTRFTQEGLHALGIAGTILTTIGNHIDIYAFDDTIIPSENDPKTSLFQSSRILAMKRALTAATSLSRSGYRYRIRAFGIGNQGVGNRGLFRQSEQTSYLDIVIVQLEAQI